MRVLKWKEIWKDEYLKWICGSANAQGGTLIIGKDDNGDVTGISNAKKLLEDIPNKIVSTMNYCKCKPCEQYNKLLKENMEKTLCLILNQKSYHK
ncbi:ATP-binding protein [Lachnospiraceae bacterium]|nr:ATP-binding protein [Lachnospiraceae bacterium]